MALSRSCGREGWRRAAKLAELRAEPRFVPGDLFETISSKRVVVGVLSSTPDLPLRASMPRVFVAPVFICPGLDQKITGDMRGPVVGMIGRKVVDA